MRWKLFLIFILLIVYSFAHEIWTTQFSPAVKFLLNYNNNLLTADSTGTIRYLQVSDGKLLWSVSIDSSPLEPILLGQDFLIASSDGHVFRFNQQGQIKWQRDLGENDNSLTAFGAGFSDPSVYVTTNRGLYQINSEGNFTLTYKKNLSMATPPSVHANQILFGADGQLIALRNPKSAKWVSDIAPFWKSTPIGKGTTIYIGALDSLVHAVNVNDGKDLWTYETRGWIVHPLLVEDALYVPSNDGYIHSLNFGGQLRWKTKLGEAIVSAPKIGFVAGRRSIIAGNNRISAVSPDNGEILWSYERNSAVTDLETIKSGSFDYTVASFADGTVLAFDIDRSCAFVYPNKNDILGFKEVKARGKILSSSPNPQAIINANGVPIGNAEINGDRWVFTFDPSKLNPGSNILTCTVRDASGEETFDELFVTRNISLPKGRFLVSANEIVPVGENIVVHVSDADDKRPVEDFRIQHGSRDTTESGNFSIIFDQEGKKIITISKTGYDPYTLMLTASSGEDDLTGLTLPLGVGLVILVVIVVGYTKFVRKKQLN